VTIIPEEFGGPDAQIGVGHVADILEGSILKRRAAGRDYGVAILAEGLANQMREEELSDYGHFERDEHGHIRLGEIEQGAACKDTISRRLKERGLKTTMVATNLGYELRCADTIPFHAAYTRNLGYAAVKFLNDGGSGAPISVIGGKMQPLPFADLLEE